MKQKIAFLFPGQGSQSLGLLASFTQHTPVIKQVFEEASAYLGYDVWRLAQEGPLETLNQTEYTQPLLLTASIALWRLYQLKQGKMPDFLAGHSLGEYTAYTCADSFDFETALHLVSKRGSYMNSTSLQRQGSMAVIVGLNVQTVEKICKTREDGAVVSPSAYNAVDQVVISGYTEAVTKVMQMAKQQGARLIKRLPISVPAHCELMQPAVKPLMLALESIPVSYPSIPVISNVHSQPLASVGEIKQSLLFQLYQPVQWLHTIHYLLAQGVNCFVECGPGNVLTHLTRYIVKNRAKVIALDSWDNFTNAF